MCRRSDCEDGGLDHVLASAACLGQARIVWARACGSVAVDVDVLWWDVVGARWCHMM